MLDWSALTEHRFREWTNQQWILRECRHQTLIRLPKSPNGDQTMAENVARGCQVVEIVANMFV